MPSPQLIDYKEWIKGTARMLHSRSKELKAVDVALKNYSPSSSLAQKQFIAVEEAFKAWKMSKGPGDRWKQTSRDGNQLFTLLDNQLQGLGDTDRALGVVDFMTNDMIHARLGALFLFSKLDCDDSIFSVVLEGAIDVTTSSLDYGGVSYDEGKVAKGKVVASEAAKLAEAKIRSLSGQEKKVSSAQLMQQVQPPTDGRLHQIWVMIRDKVLEFLDKIIAAIRKKLNEVRQSVITTMEDPAQAAMDKLPGMLRKLVDLLTSRFLAAAAPFIGAGLDIAKGIVNSLDAGVTKFKEWLASRDVVLASGHITVIVESIRRAMWMSLGSGLYDLLKGGISMGAQFASAGGAAIITLVSSIVEVLVKTAWKVIEISRLRQFFDEARDHYTAKDSGDALHKRPIAFNQWLKGYSLSLPVIPVLALNTGITGNKMLFLQMYQSDNRVVTQSQFNSGVTYLDGLKDWGSSYLKSCGFSFSSDDKMVTGLLSMAENQAAPLTTRGKVWQGVQKFLA